MSTFGPAETEAAAAVLRRLVMPVDRDDYVEWVAEEALAAARAAASPSVHEAAVAAVLNLHTNDGHDQCGRCDDWDTGQPEPYPCPTVRAITAAGVILP